jgi:two-component system sensor histidine kinase EvgS
MNIESKIRFKAAGLYIVVGIATVAMLIYLYDLRGNIKNQRTEIERQHHSLALTNKLIYAVDEAQSSVSLYVSTNDTRYINRFGREIILIDSMIDTLAVIEPVGKEKLHQISSLLSLQAANISALNQQLGKDNPVAAISEFIKGYKPRPRVVAIKKDTLYKTSTRKKGIFKRIKDIFSPEKDSTVIVSTQRVDTLRLGGSDTMPVLMEVNDMAYAAGKRYEKNIKAIGYQVTNLITSDREISTRISGLLLDIHRQTLNSVLETIDRSGRSINRNYTISIIGGILALGLILLFILLIIYDVNKGKEAREKIRQVMESRHQMLLSVSHDIKSPLGSILGYLELRGKQGEDIKSMQNSARHILALLENLLEFSSLEQGSLKLSYSDFSLDEMGEEIGQMFQPLAEAKNLSFTFVSDKVRINSDRMKLKQIVINLVSNAIKYTRAGEATLEIKYAEGQLWVKVTDTGAGIPEDKLVEIYEPFTRVETNNALAHGTGLGMYVVKGLVDLLGGTIQITSEVGKGTNIEVVIPCAPAKNKINQGAKKIAVYDDDPVILDMVRGMLVQLGHEVVEQGYDVILTDMEMGELSGLDILATAGNVPVIVMTGHSDYTVAKALELGFDGFLPKPFTLNALREIFGEGENATDDFLGEDEDAILELFRTSTAENYALLRQALNDSDFNTAQAICHKMLPMFVLLGYQADELRRMDAQRGIGFDGWKADVETILSIKV